MPNYVLILNGTEDWNPDSYSEQDFADEMAQHVAFQEAVIAAGGKVVAGEALEPSTGAVLITGSGSASPVFTDGPFTELKEVVNGYYQFEAPDLETAKRLAALVPAKSAQLFPVYDLSQLGEVPGA
jgi:hypothetical protein